MSLVLLYAIEFGYQNRGTKPKTRPEDTDTFPWYIVPKIVWISALKNIIMLPFKVLCTETGQVWLYPVDQDMYGWRFRLLFGFGTVESSNVLFSNSECTVYTGPAGNKKTILCLLGCCRRVVELAGNSQEISNQTSRYVTFCIVPSRSLESWQDKYRWRPTGTTDKQTLYLNRVTDRAQAGQESTNYN